MEELTTKVINITPELAKKYYVSYSVIFKDVETIVLL